MRPIGDRPDLSGEIDEAALDAWLEQLEQLRAEHDIAFAAYQDAKQAFDDLVRRRDALQAELDPLQTRIPQVASAITREQSQLDQLTLQADDWRAARDAAGARLLGTDAATGTVATRHPLLLLPVRLETRFADASQGGKELRVRIYPDDIHIDSHDQKLTGEEERWGRHYWQHAGTDSTRNPAWQQLAERFGALRAGWIVRALDPAAPLDPGRRAEALGRAPRAEALPDRWVAIGYRGKTAVATAWSRPITGPMAVGPAPASPPLEREGLPAIDQDMLWMVDFDTAESAGMALRIPLDAGLAQQGFDRLVVAGIKASLDPADSARSLAGLLDAHRYTSGLELISDHPPTNNTGEHASGYRSDQDERADGAPPSIAEPPAGSDGARLALALGLAPTSVGGLPGATAAEQTRAGAVNGALWPILNSPLLHQLRQYADPVLLKSHFTDFLRARGPLPALRVGSQPYGLLPVSFTARWRGRQDETPLADWWRVNRPRWNRLAAMAPSVADGSEPADLLRHDAIGCRYRGQEHTPVGRPPAVVGELAADAAMDDLLTRLPQQPAASLKRLPQEIRRILMAETVDLATYRFDAWATSLATRRLAELRQAEAGGLRLGGYGWVENLRPAAPLQPVAQPPEGVQGPLYQSPANRGHLQAPSLAQAATAAVLRSGYLAQREEQGADGAFAVDLSSERVHRARWLLDGVRQGQPLGALLGYRFERELHERGLDRYIHRFRSLAALKQRDELSQAYARVAEAAEAARAIGLIYRERDGALALAGEASLLKAQAEAERQQLQQQIARYDLLRQRVIAAQARLAGFDRELNQHRSNRPQSRVPRNLAEARNLTPELIDDAATAAWESRLDALVAQRGDALGTIGGLEAEITAGTLDLQRAGARIQQLDDPARNDSIAGLQARIDAQNQRAAELSQQAVALEGTPGKAEADLAAARAALASELSRQWSQALESVAANNVVDGLELHRRWKAGLRRRPPQAPWDAATIPFGDATFGFPATDAADFQPLQQRLQALDELVDAVGDAVVAESVHQLVQGNPLRAGATLDAIASGDTPPPELEVVRTPRSGSAVTHRLLALLPAAGAAPADWPVNELQVRAHAEPLLNAWAARLLPAPSRVRCRVEYRVGDSMVHAMELDLSALGLSPLDTVYLAAGDDRAQRSELEQRLVFHLLRNRPAGVSAEATVQLGFGRAAGWSDDTASFGELLEVTRTVRNLLAGARPIDARDLALPGALTAAGLDLAELAQRADQAVSALQQGLQRLQAGLPAEGNAADPEPLRLSLLALAHFGIQGTVPLHPVGDSDAIRAELTAQARSAARECAGRLDRIARQVAEFDVAAASPDQRRDHELGRLQGVFGADFRVLPRLTVGNPQDLSRTFGASQRLQGGDPLAAVGWFQKLACVRDGAARLDAALTYAEALGSGGRLALEVGQLPANDAERWVGLPVTADQPFPHGRLSLVAHAPLAPVSFDQPLTGLMLDEWVEVVPAAQEITGLGFHYDQPNAAAPQSLLLAVPADGRETWDLDSLAGVLNETLDLARLRALPPVIETQLERIWIGDRLPAGAIEMADGGDAWTWVRHDPPPPSGGFVHRSALSEGPHQHFFQGALAPLKLGFGDRLFADVFIDPDHPPRELMLQWHSGSWDHRAYWGENLIPWGSDGSVSRVAMGPLPQAGSWVRLEVPAAAVGLEGQIVDGMAFTLFNGGAAWDRAGTLLPQPQTQLESVWVDDRLPDGAIEMADGGDSWNWVATPYSGSLAHASALATGPHQHFFRGTSVPLPVGNGDQLFAHVYLDPNHPPREITLQWHCGGWNYRAYWGENLLSWGSDGSPSRLFMGPLPPPGRWVRLEVPAAAMVLEGQSVDGMAFSLFDGQATWDCAGRALLPASGTGPTAPLAPTLLLPETAP